MQELLAVRTNLNEFDKARQLSRTRQPELITPELEEFLRGNTLVLRLASSFLLSLSRFSCFLFFPLFSLFSFFANREEDRRVMNFFLESLAHVIGARYQATINCAESGNNSCCDTVQLWYHAIETVIISRERIVTTIVVGTKDFVFSILLIS